MSTLSSQEIIFTNYNFEYEEEDNNDDQEFNDTDLSPPYSPTFDSDSNPSSPIPMTFDLYQNEFVNDHHLPVRSNISHSSFYNLAAFVKVYLE
jgi:hypothetical protein